MKLTISIAAFSLVAALIAPAALRAEDAAANVEAQLREALRSTTLQLRSAQSDAAAAKAEKDQAQSENELLSKKLDALAKRAAADQTAAETNIANLNTQLSARNAEVASLADKLKQALDSLDQAKARIASLESDLKQAGQTKVELAHEIDQLHSDNRELFTLGSEILDRYENFGLGKAIAAREPFTKLARVKLQNIVQDYRDGLEDKRVKLPDETSSDSETTPASTASGS